MGYERFIRLKAARLALSLSVLAFASAASWPLWGMQGQVVQSASAQRPSPQQTMTSFLTDRDALRQEEIEQLLALSAAPDTESDIRTAAQRRVIDLRRWMEQEATVEAVLTARGYKPVLVTVHANSVNVLVAADRIEQADAAVMLELVSRETGVLGGNIKIIPIN